MLQFNRRLFPRWHSGDRGRGPAARSREPMHKARLQQHKNDNNGRGPQHLLCCP